MSESSPALERVNLYVLTPGEVVFEGQVLWVQVPLYDGLIGIWPGHAPLIASLSAGRLFFETGEGEQGLAVTGGILRVDEERCVVLVNSLAPMQDATGIDKEALAANLEQAVSESLSTQEIQELQVTRRSSDGE